MQGAEDGGDSWTPELTRIRLNIEVWTLVVKILKGCSVCTRTILRTKKKAGVLDIDTNVPEDYAQQQVSSCFAEYKAYLISSDEHRQTFQQELAQARSEENNKKVPKEIERMDRTEKQRTSAARIRRMNGTLRKSSGLTKVVVPGDDGNEVELVNKLEMENALL